MYRVTTSRLGPDARRVDAASESTDRGELSAEDLTILLDAFTEIDPADNEESDPHVGVSGRGAKLIIRTSRGRLQVYDVRDHAAPATEMTVPAILARLDRVEVAVPVKVGNGGIIGRSYQYPHETRIIPGLQKTCLKVKAQATRGCVPENPYPAVCICKNVHPAVTVIIGGDHPFL